MHFFEEGEKERDRERERDQGEKERNEKERETVSENTQRHKWRNKINSQIHQKLI